MFLWCGLYLAAVYSLDELEVAPVATQKRLVNISRLPPNRKRAAWDWIQQNRPAQAELIQSDVVQQTLAVFNGEIIIEMEASECDASSK